MKAAQSFWIYVGAVAILGTLVVLVQCNEEIHLMRELFKGYNKKIRPAANTEDKVEIHIKLTLTNIISLKEKEETLTSNVWITMQWVDYRLAWDPTDFYGVDIIRVPPDTVWLPDIVLENNIDGKFNFSYSANVLISNTGGIYWQPPAIYRSNCAIEITYFPFDIQNCTLAFRSQTYNAKEVELVLGIDDEYDEIAEWVVIDPAAYTENGEWAIVHRPARKVVNRQFSPEDPEYQEILFNLIIRRKPLFYIINIILPCALISSLVVLAYFLPAQAGGQKLTTAISVLLAQTVFLFLIAQRVPETSLSVPLIGKYLIFVMSVTVLIATSQIIILNFSLRTPSTHTMSHNIKHVLLEMVPRFLGMSPLVDDSEETTEINGVRERRKSSMGLMQKAEEYVLKQPRSEMMFVRQRGRFGIKETKEDTMDLSTTTNLYKSLAQAAPEIKQCVDACNFIAESKKEQNTTGSEIETWVLIGKMMDKVCFLAAIFLFIFGTVWIFLIGAFNQPPEFPFPGEIKKYLPINPKKVPLRTLT